MTKLKKCPCGSSPELLEISLVETRVHSYATCYACGYWTVEFRSSRNDLMSQKIQELAAKVWNDAPREGKDES